jgi:hypothetical protein
VIGTHELRDHVRVSKLGAECGDDCLLDPIQIEGSGIGARPSLREPGKGSVFTVRLPAGANA